MLRAASPKDCSIARFAWSFAAATGFRSKRPMDAAANSIARQLKNEPPLLQDERGQRRTRLAMRPDQSVDVDRGAQIIAKKSPSTLYVSFGVACVGIGPFLP